MKLRVNNIKNWIYVTGIMRSGTTFVGKVLSMPLQVDYIHEPFSPECGMPGIERGSIYVKPSLDSEEMQYYHQLSQSIFDYSLTLRKHVSQKDLPHRKLLKNIIGSRGPFYLNLAKINPFHNAAIIKDPRGLLLTEYLYVHFKVKPVIVIKHPLSLIASLKKQGWWPNLAGINRQQHLVADYFAGEEDWLQQKWSSPMYDSAAYWRAAHKIILEQSSRYPDWQVVLHENLSEAPVAEFEKLYAHLNLPWSTKISHKISQLTDSGRSTDARKGVVQDFKRKSSDIFKMRRDSLSLAERRAIFDIVQDVALKVYSRESFAID